MNEKRMSKLLITAGVLVVVVVAVWMTSGMLWRMLLAMHGHH